MLERGRSCNSMLERKGPAGSSQAAGLPGRWFGAGTAMVCMCQDEQEWFACGWLRVGWQAAG